VKHARYWLHDSQEAAIATVPTVHLRTPAGETEHNSVPIHLRDPASRYLS
jgi:hypothetical protein